MPVAFVTGGSGCIGRNLIRYLHARGWTLRALSRSETLLPELNFPAS
jgi:nucleoside-diphosphate-sugar epimerase